MVIDFDKYEVVDIDRLRKAPWNYKEDDAERAAQLAENMKQHGQVVNLIVRNLYRRSGRQFLEVVDGNHRLDAMLEIGFERAMVYNLEDATQEEAMHMATLINETRFPTDHVKLAHMMSDVVESLGRDTVESMGPFSARQLDAFSELQGWSWDGLAPTTEEEKETEWVSVPVSMSPDDHKAFTAAIESIADTVGLPDSGGRSVRYGAAIAIMTRHYMQEPE